MKFRSLSTRFLVLLAGAFMLATGATVWLGIHQSTTTRRQEFLGSLLQETVALNQRLRAGIHEQIELVYRHAQSPDPALYDEFQTLDFELGQAQIEYLKLDTGDRERLIVAEIRDLQAELARNAAATFAAARAGDQGSMVRGLARVEQRRGQLDDRFEALGALQLDQLRDALEDTSQAVEDAYGVLGGLVLMLLLVLVAFALSLQRQVKRPLAALLAAARQIRATDFEARAPVESDDEIGRLAREFNYMAESLQDSYGRLEQKVEERTTEIRELQSQLVQAEKMSAVGRLVSGVAHELNNPLTAVMGFAELGLEELEEAPVSRVAGRDRLTGLFRDVLDQAERCRRIVENLLQFARQKETRLEPVSLNEIVRKAVSMREYELRSSDIRLETDYDPGGPTVRADAFKIQQVVLILLNNAVDALEEAGGEGTIRVTTRPAADNGQSMAELEVTDTGPGMAAPDRVFEPFYTTKGQGEGTGLGLSVCYGIVQEHGGTVSAENADPGARFRVRLPSHGEEPATRSTTGEPASDDRVGGRVLVVDDEVPILRLQQRLLERLGLDVASAESGDDAIAYLEDHPVDLVICDIRMPGNLNGHDVYEWIRQNRPSLTSRFLFTSGDLVRLESSSDEALPARCLRKPFRSGEYRTLVQELLESGKGGT